MKALLKSLGLQGFGEAFVNLTQQWFIPLPWAGNNADVIRKLRLRNSPKYKGIFHGGKKVFPQNKYLNTADKSCPSKEGHVQFKSSVK